MRITGQQSQFHFEFETGEMFSKQIHTILQLYNSFGLYFIWFCHFNTISGEFQLIQAKMANMHATLSACRSLAIFKTAHKNISDGKKVTRIMPMIAAKKRIALGQEIYDNYDHLPPGLTFTVWLALQIKVWQIRVEVNGRISFSVVLS